MKKPETQCENCIFSGETTSQRDERLADNLKRFREIMGRCSQCGRNDEELDKLPGAVGPMWVEPHKCNQCFSEDGRLMKIREINWESIIDAVLITTKGVFALFVILAVIVMFAILLSGCTQAIVTKPDGTRYQWNTFFQKLDIGRIRTANILLEAYSEEPGNASLKVNPLFQEYEAEIGEGEYNERWRKLWQRYDAENGDDK